MGKIVNCRIGSLEISRYMEAGVEKVNCRIGSLEINSRIRGQNNYVNCRIGSLERQQKKQKTE